MTTDRVQALVESFNDQHSTAKEALRDYAERDPQGFACAGLDLLEQATDKPGYHFLVYLLLRQGSLLEFLVDPGRCSLEKALQLARASTRIGHPLDDGLVKLLVFYIESGNTDHDSASRILRLLELLYA